MVMKMGLFFSLALQLPGESIYGSQLILPFSFKPGRCGKAENNASAAPTFLLLLWYSTKLLLAGYLVLSGKRGTPLTTFLPATTIQLLFNFNRLMIDGNQHPVILPHHLSLLEAFY